MCIKCKYVFYVADESKKMNGSSNQMMDKCNKITGCMISSDQIRWMICPLFLLGLDASKEIP